MKKLLLLLLLSGLALLVCFCDRNDPEEELPAPEITGITTDYEGKAVAGMPVRLEGKNFSPTPSDNKVLYGVGLESIALEVTESSEVHLVFVAPEIAGTQLRIRAATKGKESNAVVLNYTTLPDTPEDPVEEPWDDEPTITFDGATTVTIRPGVEWTSFHGKWEGQIRNINIVRTTLNEHNKLGIYFNYGTTYPDGYTPTLAEGEDPRDLDKKCIYLDALIGTNGPMACCQFVRVNGEVKHAATDAEYWICNCAITIDGEDVDIVKVKDNFKAARLTNAADGTSLNPPDNTLTVGCAGPLLVWEGKIQEYPEDNKEDFLKTTHPRTAIGLSKDGKTVVQVAVDGRWTQSSSAERAVGMSTPILSKLMRGLGCYKAMNFDGGGGTAMWVYGQGNARNIVNRVCENRWDWNGTKLRPAGNAVYIKSDLK